MVDVRYTAGPFRIYSRGQINGTAFLTLLPGKNRKLRMTVQVRDQKDKAHPVLYEYQVFFPLLACKKIMQIAEILAPIKASNKHKWCIKKYEITKPKS